METQEIGSEVVETSPALADGNAGDNFSDHDSASENIWESVKSGTHKFSDPSPTTGEDAGEPEEASSSDSEDEPDDKSDSGAADTPDKKPDDKSDEETDKGEKSAGSRKARYEALKQSEATLKEQLAAKDSQTSELSARLEKLDTALEAHGGVEQVEKLVGTIDKFINPAKTNELLSYVASLPHAPQIENALLERAFAVGQTNPETLTPQALSRAVSNRVHVLNTTLKQDFGLTEGFSQDEMERIFNHAALSANKDRAGFFEDLDFNLRSFGEGEKSETESLAAKVTALEKQLEQRDKKPDADAENKTENQSFDWSKPENITRLSNEVDAYEADIFTDVANTELEKYESSLEKMHPLIGEALKALVRVRLSKSPVLEGVLPYIAEKQQAHENFTFLDTQLKNSVKTLLKSAIAALHAPAAAAPAANLNPKQPKDTKINGNPKESLQPTGKKPASDDDPWADYSRR